MRSRWLTSSAVFLILSILGIVIGGILRWGADDPDAANLVWALTTAIGIVPIGWEVLSGIVHRQPGVDLIAVLAMGGALALEEYLAGAVIALMLATGHALEAYADRRAHEELSSLLEGGNMVRYGAKALPEGGWHTIPRVYADGVLIAGDAGGFLNSLRLKGIHLAMRTGMLAEEAAFD